MEVPTFNNVTDLVIAQSIICPARCTMKIQYRSPAQTCILRAYLLEHKSPVPHHDSSLFQVLLNISSAYFRTPMDDKDFKL